MIEAVIWTVFFVLVGVGAILGLMAAVAMGSSPYRD
jgi:hypothetical protein